MSDSNATTTTLEYRGSLIKVDSSALEALRAKVGLSVNHVLAEVKDNIDWSAENDPEPIGNVTITTDTLAKDQ